MQPPELHVEDVLKALIPALNRFPDVFYRRIFTPIFDNRLVMDFAVNSTASDKLPLLLQAAGAIDEALRSKGYNVEECSFGSDGFKLTVIRD
jgi:hypothetical protein